MQPSFYNNVEFSGLNRQEAGNGNKDLKIIKQEDPEKGDEVINKPQEISKLI